MAEFDLDRLAELWGLTATCSSTTGELADLLATKPKPRLSSPAGRAEVRLGDCVPSGGVTSCSATAVARGCLGPPSFFSDGGFPADAPGCGNDIAVPVG